MPGEQDTGSPARRRHRIRPRASAVLEVVPRRHDNDLLTAEQRQARQERDYYVFRSTSFGSGSLPAAFSEMLADVECRHGRLPHDPPPACGCWDHEHSGALTPAYGPTVPYAPFGAWLQETVTMYGAPAVQQALGITSRRMRELLQGQPYFGASTVRQGAFRELATEFVRHALRQYGQQLHDLYPITKEQ